MRRVFCYKMNALLSNRIILIGTIILFFIMNFSAVVNSGILLSGGIEFNSITKYMLLQNNYISVSSFYGLLFAIVLGACTLGPDAQSGNLSILMSAFPSRIKYFIGTILAVFVLMAGVQLLMTGNIVLLYLAYEVAFVWNDVIVCSIQIFLNSIVILTVTAIGSIFLKGMKSVCVGIAGYCFYSMYMFNTIPIINGSLIISVSRYKDILCHIFPVIRVMAPSYTEEEVKFFYELHSFLPRVELYQVLYITAALIIGCILFWKKDLN